MSVTIKLGERVRDAATGFEGIALQRFDQLNGNVQFGVVGQVDSKATTYPEQVLIDHHLLVKLDDGVSAKSTPVMSPSSIKVGEEVQDLATDFIGITTAKATYLNGCESFTVVPKIEKGKKFLNVNSEEAWIPAIRLKKVSKGIAPPEVKKAPNGKVPGGPGRVIAKSLAR